MVDLIASLSLVAGFLGVLIFSYFQTKQVNQYIQSMQQKVVQLPYDMQQFQSQSQLQNDHRTQDLIQESFKDYLRHIQQLERMVLPKPVTTKDVQSILDRGPEIANEIETGGKEGIDLTTGDLSAIPFGSTDLNVAMDEISPFEVE